VRTSSPPATSSDEQDAQMATPVGSHDGGIAAHNVLASDEPLACESPCRSAGIFMDRPSPSLDDGGRQLLRDTLLVCTRRCLSCRAQAPSRYARIVKMVADAKINEVSRHMIGNGASEVIHEAAMALRFRARLSDFHRPLTHLPDDGRGLKIGASPGSRIAKLSSAPNEGTHGRTCGGEEGDMLSMPRARAGQNPTLVSIIGRTPR